MSSRRSASNRGRGIQLKSSSFVETLIMPFDLGPSSLFGCAQALDPHTNQSFAVVFICPNAEGDDPRRRDGLDRTRKEKRLRIAISERLQKFVPAEKFDIDVCERQLVIES